MGGGPSQKLLDMGGKGVGWGADPGNSLRVSVASVCVFAAQEPNAECRGVEGPGVCACANDKIKIAVTNSREGEQML